MPKRVIQPVGGILRDLPKIGLPDGALTSGVNIRVRNGVLETPPQFREVYTTAQVAPLWALEVVRSATDHFWIYASDEDVYVVDEGNTHKEISKSGTTYSGTATGAWNGGIFGTIPVMTNNSEVPQQWSSIDFATPQLLTDLSNWETDIASGATCKVLRPFRQYLVALNTTEGATDFPQRVRWSDKGSANTLPTWDASDPAQDAGFEDLLESYDEIIEGLPLRDRFMIYKDNETYLMSFTGGSAVMSFRQLFKTSGILATHCAVEYRGNHFVFTQGDCIVHDGNTVKSIIDRQNREYLFSQMDSVNYDRSFVCLNEEEDEVWFCFPEDGQDYATHAMTYSMQNGKWGERELPGVRFATQGEINQTGSDTWDSDSGSWDSDTSRWDESEYNPAEQKLILAGTDDTKLFEVGNSNTADGTVVRCNASRESDPFGDTDQLVRINRVRPIIEANDGTVFTIRIGTQTKPSDAIDYTDYTFTYGTDEQVNTRKTGKYISWEVETEEDTSWKLTALEFEFVAMGNR